MTMNYVEADEKRNAEPGFFHRQALHFAHVLGADHVEEIADGPVLDGLRGVPGNDGPRHGITGRSHGQLAEFLGERHLVQQDLDSGHCGLPLD